MPTVAPRLVFLIPAVLAGAVVALLVALLAPIESAAGVAILAGLLVAIGVVIVLDWRAPQTVLKTMGAEPLKAGTQPRLESLVASLCASHGMTEPDLHLVSSRALDAAVIGRPNEPKLIVTTGILRQLDRLELEAVVARELAQFNAGVYAATTLAAVGSLLGPLAKVLRQLQLNSQRLALVDSAGVMLTRYPPALAKAFEKAANGNGITATPATQHLWMIGPLDSAKAVQPVLQNRIDTLREL